MLKRHLIEFGINPILGFIVLVATFYGLSTALFSNTEYANRLYVLIATAFLLQYSENNRNDFLKFIYPKKSFIAIRILENIVTTLPFILFLTIKTAFLQISILITISIILSFWSTNNKTFFTIPTPFYKKPFEFTVGFRKSLIGFIFAYFLVVMALVNQNFNLGVFALGFSFLLCSSFYAEPEQAFFVWVHKQNVNQFLFDKISTAIVFSTLLLLPITLSLLLFFQSNIIFIIALQMLGYCYLITIILAKYAAFPHRINLPQALVLALSVTMPLFLIVIILFFYFQSKAKLKQILE